MRVRSWLPFVLVFAASCAGVLSVAGGGELCESDDDCNPGSLCRSGSCFAMPTAQCEDEDGDGAFSGPGCDTDEPQDCDDSNAGINPGSPEICDDGIDQNCFGGPDEGCDCSADGIGASRSCGTGVCVSDIQTCTSEGWSECPSPGAEICGADGLGNDLDDDCNGLVDDRCEPVCNERLDGMGREVLCPGDVTCSSNGICF